MESKKPGQKRVKALSNQRLVLVFGLHSCQRVILSFRIHHRPGELVHLTNYKRTNADVDFIFGIKINQELWKQRVSGTLYADLTIFFIDSY